MGPLISDEQFAKVLGYLESGREAGAEAVVGGGRVGERGYFVQPTVLTNTTGDMKVVREEIFGPVVCAMPFDDPDEILPIANDTNYGLAAGVFTRDISKAHRMAARLRAGTVWVNTYHVFDAAQPFGGYKESGWGRRWATRSSTTISRPRRSASPCSSLSGAWRLTAATRPGGAVRMGWWAASPHERPGVSRPPRSASSSSSATTASHGPGS